MINGSEQANKRDRVIVNMFDDLGVKKISIYGHGMYQEGINDMDGPSMAM